MSFERQLAFWLATFIVVVLLLWLLSEILLPFVAGMALAYLLDPLDRTARAGRNGQEFGGAPDRRHVRGCGDHAALVDRADSRSQFTALIANIPGYVTRLQTLLVQADWPWLGPLIGSGDASKTISDLVSQGAGWLASFVRSLWSGGRALLSIFSLAIVTPVVAYYLICDWPRMVETVERLDSGRPPHDRARSDR